MITGITKKEEQIIKKIISEYPYEFYYYGSRVKGDYTKSSDLDILIKANNEIPQNIIEELNTKFNESIIPYRVNFSDYNRLDQNFYRLIEKNLIKV
ncbi:nucleotidyltransferase domain-containing protein [bacterium]|nr:nucleotidyltransferase domain-containing protein [bacterium]